MELKLTDPEATQKVREISDRRHPRVLSLCCLYPNPVERGQGIFVQRRLQSLAEFAEVMVIAPVAVVQYGNPKGKRFHLGKRAFTARRQDGRISVLHPRWFYPPSSGILIPFWLFLQLLWPILRLRKEFSFEVIDTHFGFPEGIAGLFLSIATGVPFTMTLRGNEPKHSRGRLTRFWMACALRRASRVFTVSERLREFAIGLGAEPGRVKTTPNGIEKEIFRPRDRAACRLKHGLAGDRPVILSAGALVERKGHHRVIEALKAILDSGLCAELVVAGGPGPEGAYEMHLRRLVSALGLERSVRFAGAVPPQTMAELMTAADVLCLASTNEGWPNVVHEALACGTPVVATDVGAVPEMLDGGRYGIIVPPGEQLLLKEALAEALRRRWDRSAVSAWGQARDWTRVAMEVVEEMRTLMAGGKNR